MMDPFFFESWSYPLSLVSAFVSAISPSSQYTWFSSRSLYVADSSMTAGGHLLFKLVGIFVVLFFTQKKKNFGVLFPHTSFSHNDERLLQKAWTSYRVGGSIYLARTSTIPSEENMNRHNLIASVETPLYLMVSQISKKPCR